MNKFVSLLKTAREKTLSAYCSMFAFLFVATQAHADYDIGAPTTGPFAAIGEFIQDIVNLVDGPVALAFSFFSIVGMAMTWAFAPKLSGALAIFARITIAIIIILNVGAWIAAYQS